MCLKKFFYRFTALRITTYVLGPERACGLREATAFSAPDVWMQLLPFDQYLGCFYPSSAWRKFDNGFRLFFFFSKIVAAAKGLTNKQEKGQHKCIS